MSTIEINGQQIPVSVIENREYIKIEDMKPLLRKKEEVLEIEYHEKKTVLRGRDVDITTINGIQYLDLTQASKYLGISSTGLGIMLNQIEDNLKKQLEKKREEEIAHCGESSIDPEKDSKIRLQFRFQRQKKYISLENLNKYFLTPM